MDFDDEDETYTDVNIETLRQSQEPRFGKNRDVQRLGRIHGNLDKRATEALKYLVEVSTNESLSAHHSTFI